MTANPLRDVSNLVPSSSSTDLLHQQQGIIQKNNNNSTTQSQTMTSSSSNNASQQNINNSSKTSNNNATSTKTSAVVENDHNNNNAMLVDKKRLQDLKTLHGDSYSPEHEYTDEIYDHLFTRQLSCLRDATYLSRQSEVEERMRMILIDWLVDVSIKFKQRRETFFLAVDIVDRYLMLQPVARGQLQLVGVTAVLIAAKHEEIWAPEVRECAQITANTYSKEDIIRIEREICGALRYRFTLPTSYHFMIRLNQINSVELKCNHNLEHLVMFFLELSCVCYNMLNWQPSTVALSALILGRITWHHRLLIDQAPDFSSDVVIHPSNADNWIREYLDEPSREFCKITAIDQIAPAVYELLTFALETSKTDYRFRAVQRKFGQDKYGNVSKEPVVLPPNCFSSQSATATSSGDDENESTANEDCDSAVSSQQGPPQ